MDTLKIKPMKTLEQAQDWKGDQKSLPTFKRPDNFRLVMSKVKTAQLKRRKFTFACLTSSGKHVHMHKRELLALPKLRVKAALEGIQELNS